ncbi:MAG: DUF72 domain-containing protein [Planctomycetota bacterium]|nr:DUF72 domain-containing protein [Planctomycetota bacterium]
MIRLGTAGFSYKDWEGPVYPKPKPRDFDALAFMSRLFSCIEMNVTFYRVPSAANVASWVETVHERDDFRFTFKLYRGLTHGEEFETLAPFLDALRPCRDAGKLGALLAQFPFFFRNTLANRAHLSRLAGALEGWPVALEIRDRSWLTDPALEFIGRLGLNLSAIDICQTETSVPPGPLTTGPIGYVRLHGRNRDAWFDKKAPVIEKYNYLYSTPELERWAGHVRAIASRTEATYVITNNHFAGKAVVNAIQLGRLLNQETPPPPPQLVAAYPDAF